MRWPNVIAILFTSVLLLPSCNLDDDPNSVAGFTNDLCFQNAFDAGHVFRMDGKIWMRGGEDEDDHFDISHWSLKACQLNLGLGREHFPSLIDPNYVKASEHAGDYKPSDSLLILLAGDQVKVFPFELVRHHEVINDVVEGNPVMIHYSLLSNLAAVYKRRYCDTTFTFAVSGFTYWDYSIWNATNSFLLWDRETESLWWPLISKSVSGLMKGMWLVKYDEARWWKSSWQDVLENFPEALVLEEDQTMEPPENWPRYFEVGCK